MTTGALFKKAYMLGTAHVQHTEQQVMTGAWRWAAYMPASLASAGAGLERGGRAGADTGMSMAGMPVQ